VEAAVLAVLAVVVLVAVALEVIGKNLLDMKYLFVILLNMLFVLAQATEAQYKVLDKERVLSNTQVSILNHAVAKFTTNHQVDMYIIITNHLIGKSIEQYAIEMLQIEMKNQFAKKPWIAIAESPSNRQWKIITHPKLASTFSSTLIKNIEQKSLKPTIAKINYVEGVVESIHTMDQLLSGALTPADIQVKHTYSWLFVLALLVLGVALIIYIWFGKYLLQSFSNLNFMIGNASYEDFTMAKGIYQSNSPTIKGGAIVVGHW
jgi:uncharacterized membrane protein YgcG